MVGFCKNNLSGKDCCMQHILEQQEDFCNQHCLLQKVIKNLGHKVIFYPKFHCEFNFIEIYWGDSKHYARRKCDYTWQGLQNVVPEALESVSLRQIQDYAQKSF